MGMRRQMARRPLVEWPDHSYYIEYPPRERWRVAAGHLLVTLFLMALLCLPLVAGWVLIGIFGW